MDRQREEGYLLLPGSLLKVIAMKLFTTATTIAIFVASTALTLAVIDTIKESTRRDVLQAVSIEPPLQ